MKAAGFFFFHLRSCESSLYLHRTAQLIILPGLHQSERPRLGSDPATSLLTGECSNHCPPVPSQVPNIQILTCHALCPPSDSEPGKPLSERSRLVLGWKRNACSARRYGRAGRWGPAVHLMRSGCRPTEHGSETVGSFPARNKTRTLMQEFMTICIKFDQDLIPVQL